MALETPNKKSGSAPRHDIVDMIAAAICNGAPLDFSYRVFGGEARGLSCPPVLKACAEERPQDVVNSRYLTLCEFEALSLAARGNLVALPSATEAEAPSWSVLFHNMETFSAEEVRLGILKAAEALKDSAARVHGLHLIGARIEGDLDLTNVNLPFSVRMIACAIDGAVRIGRADVVTLDLSGSALRGIFASFLHTRGSVRLRRMVSTSVIDLGGARVDDVFDATDCVVFPLDDPPAQEAFVGDRGIFNLSLASLSNEARMIRARIYGGLTLKGCHIHRSLFLDDAILRAPIAFVERIGADIASEIVPDEERVPLVVRSSWRAEEKLARELHGDVRMTNNLDFAQVLDRKYRNSFEILKGFPMPARIAEKMNSKDPKHGQSGRLLVRLLNESPRARSACLRADGLTVSGSVFAQSVRSSGRFRCNYGSIGGSLHLQGARLRSSQDIADGIRGTLEAMGDASPTVAGWGEFKDFANDQLKKIAIDSKGAEHERKQLKRDKAENEAYALDIRGARIGGHINLHPDNRAGEIHDYDSKLKERLEEKLGAACACSKLTPQCECKTPCTCKIACECVALHNSGLEKAQERMAHVHSAYVNGQLALDASSIDGDLNLTGMLVNLHTAKAEPTKPEETHNSVEKKQDQPFLLLNQTKIGGELNLKQTIGLHGIEAQHAQIGARVTFASHSVRNGEFSKHALLLGGKMQFSDARIGGDAVFLFDRYNGPLLLLARAKLEGRLHILPAKSLQTDDPEPAKLKRRRLRDQRPKPNPPKPLPFAVFPAPEIDLRSARAAEFGHPFKAWPHDDHLLIEGFVYEQSTAYGPLAPWRRYKSKEAGPSESSDQAKASGQTEVSELTQKERRELIHEPLFWLAFAGLAILFAVVAGFWFLSGAPAPLAEAFGWQNVFLVFAWALMWLVQSLIAHFTFPRKKDSEPRAIYWLGLQRASPSVYQKRGLTIPLQPHVQAGRVLRSAGLILSANLLERDRLQRRHEQLSWRNNWPVRILLVLADWATKYGFDPLRTVAIAVLVAALAACAFHAADREGHIRPINGDLLQTLAVSRSVIEDGVERSIQQTGEQTLFGQGEPPAGAIGYAGRVVTNYPQFSSLLYAFDVMVPGLDIGQEQYWHAAPARYPDNRHADTIHAYFYTLIGPLLKIIGWLLATAIAVSLLTRVEAMIARHEE